MDLALISGKAPPLKSLSSEHFPEKKFAKHSALPGTYIPLIVYQVLQTLKVGERAEIRR